MSNTPGYNGTYILTFNGGWGWGGGCTWNYNSGGITIQFSIALGSINGQNILSGDDTVRRGIFPAEPFRQRRAPYCQTPITFTDLSGNPIATATPIPNP